MEIVLSFESNFVNFGADFHESDVINSYCDAFSTMVLHTDLYSSS